MIDEKTYLASRLLSEAVWSTDKAFRLLGIILSKVSEYPQEAIMLLFRGESLTCTFREARTRNEA